MRFKKIEIALVIFTLTALGFLLAKPYFFLDEPNILWEIKRGIAWENYFNRFISEGRPIYGWFVIKGLSIAETLSGVRYLRILSVLLTFIFCSLIYGFLKEKKMGDVSAFLISTLIFCLPGFSVFMVWSECFPQHVSSILSFCAGVLTVKVFGWMVQGERISKTKESFYILVALVLQVISLLNYQGLALAFILPGFFVLLLNSGVSMSLKLRFTKYYILIFFLSLGAYYLVYKSMLGSNQLEAASRGKMGTDFAFKLKWFCGIFMEASSMHFLLFKWFLVRYLTAFFIFYILLRDAYKKRWSDLFFLFTFCVLSFLPHLLISESWGASRNFVLMSVLIVFYAIVRCVELFPFFKTQKALFFTIPFLIISFLNINYAFVEPVGSDYKYLKEKVAEIPLIKQDTISVTFTIPPFDMHSKNSFLRFYMDEFNVSPFSFEWPVAPAIKCFYSKLHPQVSIDQIETYLRIKPINNDVERKGSIRMDLNYK